MRKLKLNISPDFTLEDIRKIRDYNYEITKDMTDEERWAYRSERWAKAGKWYNDFLERRNSEQSIVAEPEMEYKTKK